MGKTIRMILYEKDEDGSSLIKNVSEFRIPGCTTFNDLFAKNGKIRQPMRSALLGDFKKLVDGDASKITIEKINH